MTVRAPAISVGVILAALVAVGATVVVRQTVDGYYRRDVVSGLDQVRTRVRALGDSIPDPRQPPADSSANRARLQAAAGLTRASLGPLAAPARLRGSFLASADAVPHQLAVALDQDLAALTTVLDDPNSPPVNVAWQVDRVVATAATDAAAVSPQVQRRAHAYWLSQYDAAVRALDVDLYTSLDDFAEWRKNRLALWVDADRWDDMLWRVQRVQQETRRAGDRLNALPVPAEAAAAHARYDAAMVPLQQSLQYYADYIAARASVERPLRLGDELRVRFESERTQVLAELDGMLASSAASL